MAAAAPDRPGRPLAADRRAAAVGPAGDAQLDRRGRPFRGCGQFRGLLPHARPGLVVRQQPAGRGDHHCAGRDAGVRLRLRADAHRHARQRLLSGGGDAAALRALPGDRDRAGLSVRQKGAGDDRFPGAGRAPAGDAGGLGHPPLRRGRHHPGRAALLLPAGAGDPGRSGRPGRRPALRGQPCACAPRRCAPSGR